MADRLYSGAMRSLGGQYYGEPRSIPCQECGKHTRVRTLKDLNIRGDKVFCDKCARRLQSASKKRARTNSLFPRLIRQMFREAQPCVFLYPQVIYSVGIIYLLEKENLAESLTSDEMNEAEKIRDYLEPDEQVSLVARQSRIRPGGSVTTPNIIFATDRKLIIRNPTMLGLRESVEVIPYGEITAIHLQKGVFSSEVRITAPGLTTELGRFFKLSRHGIAGIPAIPKDKASKLVDVVKEGMKRMKAARAGPQVAAKPTPLEELKKLKELLDMGAITQEEYEEKKKKILEKV